MRGEFAPGVPGPVSGWGDDRGEHRHPSPIAAAAWPVGGIVSENSIDSYIRRIRKKLREVQAPQEVTTVRGVGYTLR